MRNEIIVVDPGYLSSGRCLDDILPICAINGNIAASKQSSTGMSHRGHQTGGKAPIVPLSAGTI